MPRLFDDPDDELRIARQLDARRQRQAIFREQADPAVASRVADIRRQTGLAGTALPLAKAGRSGSDPLVVRAAEAKHRAAARSGFGLHSIGDVLRGAVRVAMTVNESPLQEAQGVYRNVAAWGEGGRVGAGAVGGAAVGAGVGSVVPFAGTAIGALVGGGVGAVAGALAPEPEGKGKWELQSTAGVAAGDIVSGKSVDLGTGFFSGGEVRAEHERRASRVTVGGLSLTPGRFLASSVVEPGSRPYDLVSGFADATIALKFDPTAAAFKGVGRAREADRLFVSVKDAAGAVNGTRTTVIADRVAGWLASADGDRVLNAVAGTNDTYDVWRLLGRKVSPDVAAALADTRSAAEARDILEPLLGVAIREKPVLPGIVSRYSEQAFRAVARRDPNEIRALAQMPSGAWHVDDVAQRVEQTERFLKNARMGDDAIRKYVDLVARAQSPAEVYDAVVTQMLPDVMGTLSGKVGATKARKLTTAWKNNYRELTRYFVDEIGENVAVKQVTIGGSTFDVPTPHLWNELLHSSIPAPDARAIRRVTSGSDAHLGSLWAKAVNSKHWDVTTNVLDFISQDVWKPFALLRGAWAVRVVGEEQVRMAGAGLDSVISHPLRAIAWATGRAERGNADVLGNAFDDAAEFVASQSLKGGGWRNRIISHGKTVINREDDVERYVAGWHGELSQLSNDPVAKVVAGGPPIGSMPGTPTGNLLDDAKTWFWSGKGSKFRQEMAQASGKADLLTPQGADDYIDSVFRRIQIKTGGDTDLVEAVATGKLNGRLLEDAAVRTDLGTYAAAGIGPEATRADIVLAGRPTAGGKVGEYMNQVTDFLFTNLMSKETNYLSRSPAFRQFYYKRLEELVPFMDDASQALAISGARAAGVAESADRMVTLAGKGVGNLVLDEADAIAKGFGLDATKKLLFDLSEKSQAADITRIIFPFAEAWREILTNWSRIGLENPVVVRRAQQTIEGARGAGFFSKDEATGQEMFNYPGTGFLMKKLTGVDAPLRASSAALNLFSNNPFIPGFGPVIQIGVGKFIPDKPQWDLVRDVITPYGDADTGDGFVESFLPPWVQKWRTAMDDPQSDRQFANTVMDVARYLASTGEYSTSTVEEQERLSAAAVEKARLMYLFRGAAQWIAPAAPSPKFLAHDKAGNVVTAFKLTEEFRKLQEADYETAVQKFLDTYGEGALLYMQAKSRGGFTPTDQLHEWVRDNPKLAARYKGVYGFFAPSAGEFDLTEQERQIATGERDALSPNDAMALANSRVASAKYRAARDRVGTQPSAGQKAWLRDVKDALVNEYPGYEPDVVELGAVDEKVRELYRAVQEPAIARTDAGRALVKYLSARDRAEAAAQAKGLAGFGQAKAMRGTRMWLRSVAEALAAEHPDFLPLYERVLEREMTDDDVQEVAA